MCKFVVCGEGVGYMCVYVLMFEVKAWDICECMSDV